MENKIEDRRSMRTKEFIEVYKNLTTAEKKLAKEAFKLWKENSPQVTFKALGQTNNLFWSAKVSDGIRAVARKTKDHNGDNFYVWSWIGTRENFKHDLKRLMNSKNISNIVNRMRGDGTRPKVPKLQQP